MNCLPMSSLTHEAGSRTGYRLRLYTAAGRKSIWLGEIPASEAAAVQRHCDEIVASQTADLPIPRATQQWLDRISPDLRRKLQTITGATRTVSMAVDQYIDARANEWAESTMLSVSRSLDLLTDAVGSRRIDAVAHGDLSSAIDALPQSESTRARIAAAWRAFWSWCCERHWIAESPARFLRGAIDVREKHFVPMADWQRMVDACDCPELRLVLGLSRIGGIRISSEIRAFDASSIDARQLRMRIVDTKRGQDRWVPIFPELRPLVPLDGSDPLPTLRDCPHATLTHRLTELQQRCGITAWPAPWHSMRASRETELITAFGVATAARWIGNSPAVALRSYAMVSDADWQRATNRETP
jgi:integrase